MNIAHTQHLQPYAHTYYNILLYVHLSTVQCKQMYNVIGEYIGVEGDKRNTSKPSVEGEKQKVKKGVKQRETRGTLLS